ncbi:type II secretion system protein GspM [Methylocapsa acidiphila]|uniref:type II secretion system protein GspM n=1 Tax=Methylocapsa acidiphila TaxID=133552 RepID=UPI00041B3951|nr:type II secretion system protein GspM [Methylocapsa acidiphila]
MNRIRSLLRGLTRDQAFALAGFAAAMAGFALIVWSSLSSLIDDYQAYSTASELLDNIEKRGRQAAQLTPPGGGASGSPFLEGRTVTVAGAALQQRVGAAVAQAGGNVRSSQIDLQGTQAEQGYVTVTVNCEISQTGLQPLLYDLEAGMPFLFIEQLVIQTPQSSSDKEGPMRVRIDVSGQWQVEK